MKKIKKYIKEIILSILIITNLVMLITPVSKIGKYSGTVEDYNGFGVLFEIKFSKDTVKMTRALEDVYVGFYDINDKDIYVKAYKIDGESKISTVLKKENVFCLIDENSNTKFINRTVNFLQFLFIITDVFLIILIFTDRVIKSKYKEVRAKEEQKE